MSLGAYTRNPLKRRVVVTGVGMVTPLGTNVASSWEGLLGGRTASVSLNQQNCPSYVPLTIKNNQPLVDNLFLKMACKVVAPVAASEEKRFAATPRETRAQLFARVAVVEAMQDCGQDNFLEFYSNLKNDFNNNDDGAAGSSSSGSESNRKTDETTKATQNKCETVGVNFSMGMPGLPEVSDAAWHLFGRGGDTCEPNKIHPYFVPKVLANTIAGDIARSYQLRGPCHSSITACATGAHCIGDAARWIQHGDCKAVICGSTEACIHPVSIAGFGRMKALATKFNDTPGTASRPFDAERGGFVMGEGCGALVLEDLENALARGVKLEDIYGEVRGYGLSGDAHHVSSPLQDGSGVIQCVRAALHDAEVAPQQVRYVNAHATSTLMGDEIELRALTKALRPVSSSPPTSPSGLLHPDVGSVAAEDEKLHPDQKLLVSSCKGNIGHLLGAAGSVEAIVALKAMKEGIFPATANLTTLPPPEQYNQERVHLLQEATYLWTGGDSSSPSPPTSRCVVSTSFGFGGTNTALVFAPMK